MAVSRFLTHAVVLVIAIALSGYASIDRHLPASFSLRLGTVNAAGLVNSQGGEVGDIRLGRLSTIIKPVSAPTSPLVSHDVILYTVADGEDLKAIATKFHVSEDEIRWSNYNALKQTDRSVSAGDKIAIPPISGFVLTVQPGDTAESLAKTYNLDAQAIVDYNYLRDPAILAEGSQLVIPGAKGPELIAPPPPTPIRTVLGAPARNASSPAYTVASGGPAAGSNTGNRFAYGYCTWYVATRRPVPWLGNAWEWYGQAQAYGWATGKTPRAGAIMVTYESGWGHVALVESVNANGSFTVSEMNFRGWGVISQRTITTGQIPLIGFIY